MTTKTMLGCLVLISGCADPGVGAEPIDPSDMTVVKARDMAPDAGRDAGTDAGGDAGCTLGTADHCGTCATHCPPAKDDVGTHRTCSAATPAGTCDITCKGEYYDVNGRSDDGCELIDDPVQDTADTAVPITLPDKNDPNYMSNPLNIVGKIYGDGRVHDAEPVMRPEGRDDWYAITAIGKGVPNATMQACLGIFNFPKDNTFEVCISDLGMGAFNPGSCKMVSGTATSVCVQPPMGSDAGTPYYVRVRKVEGPTPSTNGYALFLQH